MKTIKEIEKKFDEKYYRGGNDGTYCVKHDLPATPKEIKSYYRQQIKEILSKQKAECLEKLFAQYKKLNGLHADHCEKKLQKEIIKRKEFARIKYNIGYEVGEEQAKRELVKELKSNPIVRKRLTYPEIDQVLAKYKEVK